MLIIGLTSDGSLPCCASACTCPTPLKAGEFERASEEGPVGGLTADGSRSKWY